MLQDRQIDQNRPYKHIHVYRNFDSRQHMPPQKQGSIYHHTNKVEWNANKSII